MLDTDRVKNRGVIGMVAQQVGGKRVAVVRTWRKPVVRIKQLPAALASVQGWVSAKLQ